MRLLEHQAKTLLGRFGIELTESHLVATPNEATRAATSIGAPVVLKAQVPFGGRGRAGAVKVVSILDEVAPAARSILGMELRGFPVTTLSVERKVDVRDELYVGVVWDTSAKLPAALLSSSGGVDVEHGAEERLVRETFDPWDGLSFEAASSMTKAASLPESIQSDVSGVLKRLSRAFLDSDALTAEINPLVLTTRGEVIGLDAHVEVEDDALFRQQATLEGLGGELVPTSAGRPPTPLELEAQRIDAMDYRGVAGRVVEFDGDLALLIGGGGASLTVFDAVRRHGGSPANYCEIGGNPTEEKVAALTALLVSKPGVRRLAVIMNVVNNTRADVIARGVIEGLERARLLPAEILTVFRVPGSWEVEASETLARAGVRALGREVSLDEAARRAVEGEPC